MSAPRRKRGGRRPEVASSCPTYRRIRAASPPRIIQRNIRSAILDNDEYLDNGERGLPRFGMRRMEAQIHHAVGDRLRKDLNGDPNSGMAADGDGRLQEASPCTDGAGSRERAAVFYHTDARPLADCRNSISAKFLDD